MTNTVLLVFNLHAEHFYVSIWFWYFWSSNPKLCLVQNLCQHVLQITLHTDHKISLEKRKLKTIMGLCNSVYHSPWPLRVQEQVKRSPGSLRQYMGSRETLSG